MQYADGIWFPDEEIHLIKMLKQAPRIDGKGTYQHHKLTAAMQYVKKKRCALDIGMHVGLWAMHLAKIFKNVIGFEPVSDHIECLRLNMDNITNYVVHNCALGDRTASVGVKILKGSTGSTHINDDIDDGIAMFPLDHFKFDVVDFIKIDVEGYEYRVVEGGEKIIRAHKPVIIIEQKPGKVEWYGHKQYDAKKLLESWGAKHRFDISGDICLSW